MKRWYMWLLLSIILHYVVDTPLSASFFLQSDQSEEMVCLFKQADDQNTLNKSSHYDSLGVLKPSTYKSDYLLKTPLGISVPVTFYDRGSKDLLIFGQGFPGRRESGENIAHLFYNYDVVLFDYRWSRMVNFCVQPSTLLHPIEKFLLEEDEEVRTVTRFITSKKEYAQVIGLAQCYSCFTFAKAQYQEQCAGSSLFTKLIFDSCWYSFYDFGEQILKDPLLLLSPQGGGTPHEIKTILNLTVAQALFQCVMRTVVPNASIDYYLSNLERMPFLFIHGTQDLLVPFTTVFPKIWNSVSGRKACFITPRTHSKSVEDALLYHFMCDTFIRAHSIDKFLEDARILHQL